MIFLKRINLKPVISLLLIFIFLSFGHIYGKDTFFASLGYSPGMTDHFRTDPDPHTHTYKLIPFGLDLYTAYLFENKMGIGLDVHWGIIDKMIIKNDSARIVVEDWDGTVSQLNISPCLLYEPFRNEKTNLILGFGPSYTMNFYLSPYGNDLSEHYFGVSIHARYNYFITDYLFFNTGMRLNLEIIGIWDSELLTSVIQTHYYPSLAMGIRF